MIESAGQVVLPGFGVPFVPQGHHFPVPGLAPGTLWDYPVAMTLDTVADFASVLLGRGMLTATDWTGKLVESVNAGLERWANTVMGAHRLEYIDVGLVYTDEIQNLYFQHDEWLEQAPFNGHPDGECARYGAFALECSTCELCEVGGRVRELEAIEPGAGYSCARILMYGLMEFFPYTPQTTEETIAQYEEWNEPEDPDRDLDGPVLDTHSNEGVTRSGDHSEDDYDGFPKMSTLEEQVPKAMYGGPYDPEPVRRTLGKTTDHGLVRLLQDCLDLHDLSAEAQTAAQDTQGTGVFGHGGYAWEQHVPPVALFYAMNGVEERVFDDFHNGMAQGEHTYLCFMHAFDMDNKDALNRGASALWWALRLIVLSDSVLQGLNWDTTRDHRFDTRVRDYEEKVAEAKARRAQNTTRPPA